MPEDTPSPFNRYQAEWLARELGEIKARLAKLERGAPDPEPAVAPLPEAA